MWKLDDNRIFDQGAVALYTRHVYENGAAQIGIEVGQHYAINVEGPAAETLWLHLCAACEHANSPIELELVKALEWIFEAGNKKLSKSPNLEWQIVVERAGHALQARDRTLGLQAEAEQTAKALLKIKHEESEE